MNNQQKQSFADGAMIKAALIDSVKKMGPKTQVENPVMFLVYLSAWLTTVFFFFALAGIQDAPTAYIFTIAIILWLTVLFANFAQAIAEGRGKAQADALRSSKKEVEARRVASLDDLETVETVCSPDLHKGDLVLVKAGETIPADGDVVLGAASVDESAITGESAPVIREAGGDRSAVTGGTSVLSDWIVLQVVNEAGNSFLDQMISMVEGANRKKTPNEIALQIFLIALSMIFILVTIALYAFSAFSATMEGATNPVSITTCVALLVCLAPTTIGASAFRHRHRRHVAPEPGQCARHERTRHRGGRRRRHSHA